MTKKIFPWDDLLVQIATFAGVMVCLIQHAIRRHQDFSGVFQNGWIVTASITAFGIVAMSELRGNGVSPENHRNGKRKNVVRRVVSALFAGYFLPGFATSF